MPHTNKFRFNNYCVCGNQDCFLVQTQLCQLLSPPTTGDDDQRPPTPTDVWCRLKPLCIKFNPTESNYRLWLFLLSICHHIPRFKDVFLAFVSEVFPEDNTLPTTSKTTSANWYINWIHFPRGLLENRSTYKILQNVTLMSPAVAKRLTLHDDNKSRMLEHVNTVGFLDRFATRILSTNALSAFRQAKTTDNGFDSSYYVQAPVEVLNEARLVLSALTTISSCSTNTPKRSINRRVETPKRKQCSQLVTPSTKKRKTAIQQQPSPLSFLDAIVATTTSSPATTDRVGLTTTTERLSSANDTSPIKDITFIDKCKESIQIGYPGKTFNFYNSLKAYRLHHDQTEAIHVTNKETSDAWLYPCRNRDCKSEGFRILRQRRLQSDRGVQLCPGCQLSQQKLTRNDCDRKRRKESITRISPITAMNDDEKKETIQHKQVSVKRFKQANKRLRDQLQRKNSKIMTINNVSEASEVIATVYTFLKSKRLDATKILLDAVIDMETSNRIAVEDEKSRVEYVEFIASEISNTCKLFNGKPSQIRFHPVMINLAMNLYIGMKYEDGADHAPFVFPTVKTLQRHRSLVATHEGRDPKVYVRALEMEGFRSETDMFIHWLFDEVKLTSGVMWNATNDDLRGLCCGTTGSAEDLKDLLEDLYDTTSETVSCDDEERDGIYCNQWLARNPYGTTLLGEFFYNNGTLDGNEIMRQFLQVSTSAAIANLKTVGLVSDMGGCNDRFYHHLRDGASIPVGLLWPTDHVTCINPVEPDRNLHMWSCSTHGLKNVRSQMEMSRRNGSGSRQFLTSDGDNFGWGSVRDAFNRDKEREKNGGNFRTTLSAQAVELDSFSKMNASLAKQPYTEKTLSAIMSYCSEVLNCKEVKKEMIRVKDTCSYKAAGSGEKLRLHLQVLLDLPRERKLPIVGDLAYLQFAVSVHCIYIQRFMSRHWGLTLKTIVEEEAKVKQSLMFFETWRLATIEYKADDVSITRKHRERFFLSTQTYRNMKFGICGFFEYARYILHHTSGHIRYVNSGHSNTSALESRFSIAKRAQLNDTARYHHAAANSNSISTYKHKLEGDKRAAKKMKKGNTSYPGELIAPERPELAKTDYLVGIVLKSRKAKVDGLLSGVLLSKDGWQEAPRTEMILPTPIRRPPLTRVCKELLPKLQKQRVEGGSFVEQLRIDEAIRDLMVLTLESTHWESMKLFLSETGSQRIEEECKYLVEVAFEVVDNAVAAAKLSPKASLWWQVMKRMRDESVHRNSPNPAITNHVRSYLFQLLCERVFVWSRKALGGEEDDLAARKSKFDIPGEIIDFDTIASDVNTFAGFALFSVKKKYGEIEELESGSDAEDKYWLLTDLIATEEEISSDEAYCEKYYDSYFVVLNRGNMTLVSPRYVELFHKILFHVYKSLNVMKMIENRNNFMEKARDEVTRNLPNWSKDLQRRAEGVHMVNPEKACQELLSEIICKIFNSKGNAVLKRYYSIFLARGGKEVSSRSSLRESRKQEGLGKRRTKKPKKTDAPLG